MQENFVSLEYCLLIESHHLKKKKKTKKRRTFLHLYSGDSVVNDLEFNIFRLGELLIN